MGTRGPVPNRSDARRRRNKPEVEITKVNVAELVNQDIQIPAADHDWHPVAKQWYESLARSGQAAFYEPSDWATAFLIAESLSRDLGEQVVGITEQGDVVKSEIPMKGASLSAYLKGMAALMVMEGDRRRLQVELERERSKAAVAEAAGVTSISSRRAARVQRSS